MSQVYQPSSNGYPHPESHAYRRRQQSRRSEDIVRNRLVACERKQVAQQIHDDLGSVLTALKSCICVAIDRANKAGAPANSLLTDAQMLADIAFSTVRKIGVDLRPTMLEQMGFWKAIEWQIRSLTHRSGIRAVWYVDASIYLRPFSESAERLLFRFIYEALNNTEKHACASVLQARLFARDGYVFAVIEDDGIGASAQLLEGCGSLGMVGMRERAHAVGGWIQTETAEGEGMAVLLAMPGTFFYEH